MLSLLLPCALLLPGALASSWSSYGSSPAVELVEAELWIETYNVNFGLEGDPETTAAIGEGDPDLVLLQETTPGWERALREAYAQDYPHMAFIDGPGAGGQGLLSRWPVIDDQVFPSPVGWFPGWLLVIDTPQGPLQILSLHLKPPYAELGGFLLGAFTTGDDRLAELDVYQSFLDPTLPTVVLGDFNEQRGPSLRLLESLGFADALPAGAETWRWPVAGLELGAALDHVFYGPGLIPVHSEVQQLGRSDHLPVLVGFVRD
jgi:endonuclease/exonuclease/phosphatase (EEP) superfamily protein YafD